MFCLARLAKLMFNCIQSSRSFSIVLYNHRVGTENRTSLDNPVILAIESFKVTSYKFRFSDEMMFILPSNDFLLEFFGQLLQTNK